MIQLTFLGTGTSTGIPLIGCNCPTCTSNDPKDKRLRSSVLISTPQLRVLIDAGPDLRQQLLRQAPGSLDGILLTHEHYDHVGGLDDVRPLGNITVYAEQNVIDSIRRTMPYCFSANPYPGVPNIHLRPITTTDFCINNQVIIPVRVMHHRLPILGFRIGNTAYLTDVKTVPEESIAKLKGLDTLVVNALRTEPHIAHLSIREAIDLAQKIDARQTFFTHFSHDIGKHEIVSLNLPENFFLAYDGLTIHTE